MKLTLFLNAFVHDGEQLVSASVMVKRSDTDIVGTFSTSVYARKGDRFECAFQTVSNARAIQSLMENLGNTVEVDPALTSLDAICERLDKEVQK